MRVYGVRDVHRTGCLSLRRGSAGKGKG
jgi:hypothetical protein